MVGVLGERLQHVLAAGDHLERVVGGDVGREELGLACLVLGPAHRVGDQAHRLPVGGERLVALGLVVLDEVAAQPEVVAGLREQLRPQAQLGLDDGADDHAAVLQRPSQHAPHVDDVQRRAVEEPQVGGRHVEIVQLGVLDVTHALVVADAQGQERDDHRSPVRDVTVEELDRIGDLHQLARLVGLVDQRVDRAREVVGGTHLDVGTGRRFGGEVGRRGCVPVARLRTHGVGTEDVPSAVYQAGLGELRLDVAIRLVHARLLVPDTGGCRPETDSYQQLHTSTTATAVGDARPAGDVPRRRSANGQTAGAGGRPAAPPGAPAARRSATVRRIATPMC